MIDEKQVVQMKVPFPTISSALARKKHMYLCVEKEDSSKEFVKCQSFKPKHLNQNLRPHRRVVEESDISRNPFNKKTILDCDKTFLIQEIQICNTLLTTNRIDVCDDLFTKVLKKINYNGMEAIQFSRDELIMLNEKIS